MSEKSAPKSPPKALRIAEHEAPVVETNLQRRESVVIGRGTECDVVIHDAKASRQHCKLTRSKNGFILEDLASRNGTFVDGNRITGPVALQANHTFKIGDTVFYLT